MSMNAKELRIGNILLFSNKIQPDHYVTVDGRFLSVFHAGNGYEISNYYSGIPLTPEILIKAGFKKVVGKNRFEHDLLPNDIIYSVGFYIAFVKPEIKFLHQLQNLFLYFTGEELKFEI